MAVASKLSNGSIILLLTPREAISIADELLDPGDFPWQSTESQITGMEVRRVLRALVAEDTHLHLAEAEQLVAQQQAEQAAPPATKKVVKKTD